MQSLILTLSLLSSALTSLQVTLTEIKVAEARGIALEAPVVPQDSREDKIREYIAKLRKCESGGKDTALNPKDTDGTESIGRFQFKTATFYGFAKQYNIKVTSVWNGDEQEQILRRMIDDPKVKFRGQFPACTRMIGLPPMIPLQKG